jgi:hypothetical protein
MKIASTLTCGLFMFFGGIRSGNKSKSCCSSISIDSNNSIHKVESSFRKDNLFSTSILNDAQWYAYGKKNKTIEANYGGKITQLGRYWYWVGTGSKILVSNVWRTGFSTLFHLSSGRTDFVRL